MQVGPLFFLVGCKAGIFGITDENSNKTDLFIIDESDVIGKGANSTISMVFHNIKSLPTYNEDGSPQLKLHLNADNCSGQNKNNYFIFFLVWIVSVCKYFKECYFNFLIEGHTKSLRDRAFGNFKKSYMNSSVKTLSDMVNIAKMSSNLNPIITKAHISNQNTRQVHW